MANTPVTLAKFTHTPNEQASRAGAKIEAYLSSLEDDDPTRVAMLAQILQKKQQIEASIAASMEEQARLAEIDRKLAEYYIELANQEPIKSFVPEEPSLDVVSPKVEHSGDESALSFGARLSAVKKVLDPTSTSVAEAGASISSFTPQQWHEFTETIKEKYSPDTVKVDDTGNELHIVEPTKNIDVTAVRGDNGDVQIKSNKVDNKGNIDVICDLIREAAKTTGHREVNIYSGTTREIMQLSANLKQDTPPYNIVISQTIVDRMDREAEGNPAIGEFVKDYKASKGQKVPDPVVIPMPKRSTPKLLDLADAGSAVKAIEAIVKQAKEIQKQYADGTPERVRLSELVNDLRIIKNEIGENKTISEAQRDKIQKLSQTITSLDKAAPRSPTPSSSLD